MRRKKSLKVDASNILGPNIKEVETSNKTLPKELSVSGKNGERMLKHYVMEVLSKLKDKIY